MIYDCFTYNGEADLLEIRLNILDKHVKEFIIVEAPTTFSGKPKPLYYEKDKERFKAWHHKIRYYVINESYTDAEVLQSMDSPNTQGASHWKREFLQKESIKKALVHLKDSDVVFIGDVDEIWNPDLILSRQDTLRKLKLKVYLYYLNNRSNEIFWGTLVGKYKDIKGECLNHLRTQTWKTETEFGWHFTSMGGYEEVRRKLSDSYTRESYWTDWVENNLRDNVEKSKDFLGRGFTYRIDESELPRYLKDNKQKWKKLFL